MLMQFLFALQNAKLAKFGILFAALAALPGCAIHQWKVNQLDQELRIGSFESALAKLNSVDIPDRDRAQLELNRGMLNHYLGDFAQSNANFDTAAKIMEQYQAVSVIENIGAATINETLRVYTGTSEERVLLHLISLVNYLALNDIDGARVEALQGDVLMKTIGENAQLPSMHFLTGVIYELLKEYDNALISYRKSLELYKKQNLGIPNALKKSILLLSKSQGHSKEFAKLKKRFGNIKGEFGDGFIVLLSGVVEPKKQQKNVVFDAVTQVHHTLSLPYYFGNNVPPLKHQKQVSGLSVAFDLIEDNNRLARAALSRELPKITAFSLARVVSRYQAIKKARDENNHALAFGLNIIGVATETADLRSWNTLPAGLYITRLPQQQFKEMSQENNESPKVMIMNTLKRESVNVE